MGKSQHAACGIIHKSGESQYNNKERVFSTFTDENMHPARVMVVGRTP